jgi:amphi-Trp domain-containing protein
MHDVKLKNRDVEKTYTTKQFVEKLRRLADCLEKGENFDIQIAGERIYVPKSAVFNVEHERNGPNEEVEFQIKWKN